MRNLNTIHETFHTADFFEKEKNKYICFLCPRSCKLNDGQLGYCGVRGVQRQKSVSLAYGHPTGFAVDPMEKKPLYHFLPGRPILSFGTLGCNLGCKFCQNWHSSKRDGTHLELTVDATPDEVIELAVSHNVPAIAFTYNEPIIWAEYMIDIAKEARKNGIKTVMVTDGYVSDKAFPRVFEYIDAANVDLKAITDIFYKKMTSASLQPVLGTLRRLRKETSVWVEITNLIIPDCNDGEEEIDRLIDFVRDALGEATPLHFSAFHPSYRLMNKPRTPAIKLERAYKAACAKGMKYVYIGNIASKIGNDTVCPSCNKTVIKREWFQVTSLNANQNGECAFCGAKLDGVFH